MKNTITSKKTKRWALFKDRKNDTLQEEEPRSFPYEMSNLRLKPRGDVSPEDSPSERETQKHRETEGGFPHSAFLSFLKIQQRLIR